MGMFSTITEKKNCEDCGKELILQTRAIWLKYGKLDIYVGDGYHIELDKNFHGEVEGYCASEFGGGCGLIHTYEIEDGKLILTKKQTKEEWAKDKYE